ncbi:hypothetical protein M758_5G093900 [Ceratodon purpureus]|nr:hypothetical protein M758_5G093900 [Ceratodon purpureus]
MEADEIRVVLARASELHAKISEAIERALKTEFQRSTSSRSLDSNFSSVLDGDESNDFARFDRDSDKSVSIGDSNVEARTLGLIRDALETLEEQLEALQSMQNHQRAEKDAVLAELEESRHLLLLKLKNHQGREWEVVQEALAFAGEPVEERDDLLLPPYPRPAVDVAFVVDEQSPKHLSRPVSLPKSRAVKRLSLSEGDDLEKEVEKEDVIESEQEYEEAERRPGHKVVAGGIVLAGSLWKGVSGSVGNAVVQAAKAAVVVASVVAFMAFTEHNHRQVEQKPRPVPSAVKPVFLSESRPRPPSPPKCPPGKKLVVLEDGNAKCVVKERFELPFSKEVKDPDVLYGRG